MYQVDSYPRISWRRRLLVVLLTLAAVTFVLFAMTSNPVPANFKPFQQADKPVCEPGQNVDCVGGTATVILAPAAPVLPVLPVLPAAPSPAAASAPP